MRAELTIRPLEERDLDALLQLFDAVADERMWLGTEPGYDRDRYRTGFRAAMRGEWGTAIVACLDASLAGYVGVHPHDVYGYVLGMLVNRRFRRRGVGRALLEAAMAWARERSIPKLALLVFPHNTAAIALYRWAGFEEIERYENDVTRSSGEVWDTILMEKRLS